MEIFGATARLWRSHNAAILLHEIFIRMGLDSTQIYDLAADQVAWRIWRSLEIAAGFYRHEAPQEATWLAGGHDDENPQPPGLDGQVGRSRARTEGGVHGLEVLQPANNGIQSGQTGV